MTTVWMIIVLMGVAFASTPSHACSMGDEPQYKVYPGEEILVRFDWISGWTSVDSLTVTLADGTAVPHTYQFWDSSVVGQVTGLLVIRADDPFPAELLDVAVTAANGESITFQVQGAESASLFKADIPSNLEWHRMYDYKTRSVEGCLTPEPAGPASVDDTYITTNDSLKYDVTDEGGSFGHILRATMADGSEVEYFEYRGFSPLDREPREFRTQVPDDAVCIALRTITLGGEIGPEVESCSPILDDRTGTSDSPGTPGEDGTQDDDGCSATGTPSPDSFLLILFAVFAFWTRRKAHHMGKG